ncbi:multimeric flavodoxin WrbA [Kibdelosporangium banguiense]|uniref:Multimeric flavodoxin WrbA n=1 Tax=Kibdelosporangium banguiense TaxID=1365924 RepID=A0ABS4TQH6_9PSEU|nr:NAD(P)H-dependent oxidoreductase [Kibdelosporangium banguiense]MBP2326657.1 multimeric flavodoxin WrbA [Kibdelosporangium banguiense]
MTTANQPRVLALVCTLTPSPAGSSSDLLAQQVLEQFEANGVPGQAIRVVNRDVRPGVAVDMGDGDAWPEIREKLLASDILLLATPIWLGHPSSIAQRVLERLDGELSETDDNGLPYMYNKVATVAVVGNEDGAHKVSADLFQALDDIGFSIPAGGVTYWVGEAMQGTDFKDLDKVPDTVAQTTEQLAKNATHLARLLRASPYPA